MLKLASDLEIGGVIKVYQKKISTVLILYYFSKYINISLKTTNDNDVISINVKTNK